VWEGEWAILDQVKVVCVVLEAGQE
jgi:hypothetical protein